MGREGAVVVWGALMLKDIVAFFIILIFRESGVCVGLIYISSCVMFLFFW